MRLLRRDRDESPDRWIIVGLGNPGDRYRNTRHNVGAMVIETLAARAGVALKRHKSGCLAADATLVGARVVVARPATYMNESGRPVRALVDFYKAPPDRLLVAHDELDIPFAELRVKRGGGTAGHNGLSSIVSHLGTKDFVRLRVGIGRPRGRSDAVGHVLDTFSSAERKDLPFVIEEAADAAERVVEVGPERAMNEVNERPDER